MMDEPTIYNRALTLIEIFNIYADAKGKDFTHPYFTSPSPLPDASLGVSYTQQLTIKLGTAPIRFSLSRGTPPTRMTLSSAGMVSGNPSIQGTFNFTVRDTDAAELFNDELYVFKVS